MEFREPNSPEEFKNYLHTRWIVLRKPWGFVKDSEVDDLENISFHMMALSNDKIAGVGRLTVQDKNIGQIRYMGVREEFRKQQVGKGILEKLERQAILMGLEEIFLNARKEAQQFYISMGYRIEGKPFNGFANISHTKMVKKLI